MSKLREHLNDTARRQRGGLGFAPMKGASASAHVLVIAEVADAAQARSALDAGASALLCTGGPESVAAIVDVAGNAPVGCRLEAATSEQAAAIAEAKADFLLFDDGRSAADALLERRLGRVLLLEDGPDEERLRMLAPLGLDAMLLPASPNTLSVRDQLRLRRIVELARAPLIIPAAGPVSTATLEVWRDAGGAAVLTAATPPDALATLVQAAGEVRPPRGPTGERSDATLPPTSASVIAIDEHDDDHDSEFDPI